MSWLGKLFGSGPGVAPVRVRSVADLERELAGGLPVILDVWSPTCAPCKQLEPVIMRLAAKYAGRIRVAELDTAGAEPALLTRLAVRATPTVVVFDRGLEIGRMAGYRPLAWFDDMIAAELSDARRQDA